MNITQMRSSHMKHGLIFAFAVGLIGVAVLQYSRAAAPSVHIEAESGNLLGGASIVSDSEASNNFAVTLGSGTTACTGVDIAAGEDIQAVVNAHSAGTTYCLQAGLYREQSVTPKEGDRFIGVGSVILNGSRILTGFTQDGSLWKIGGQTQEGQIHGECASDSPRCNRPEDIYIDNQMKRHVATKSEVGAGSWYFDYATDTIFLGDNPNGKTVETTVTRNAFSGYVGGVTIQNVTVEKYANPAQTGAVMAGNGPGGPNISIAGWTIDTVVAQYNHGGGIEYVNANGMVIRNSKVLYNGQIGLGGTGTNVLIENNEIAHNNTARYSYGWEGGGTKFALTDGLTVRNNYSHNNFGPGLWTDIDNRNVLYEDNQVIDNESAGIFHEISYNAIIRRNYIEANGIRDHAWCYGGGIQISASRYVEVYENVLKNNARSIVGIQQTRGKDWVVTNLNVHHNTITNDSVSESVTGLCRDNADDIYSVTANNRFDYNTYFGDGQGFSWSDQGLGNNWSAWQGYGHDLHGAFALP